MIKVYFESNSHAELVATFESEELYIVSLPALEKKAKEQGMMSQRLMKNKNGRLSASISKRLT